MTPSQEFPIIAANWKCYLDYPAVSAYAEWLKRCTISRGHVFVFASHCYLPALLPVVSKHISLGAQDVSVVGKGAYTGEVSAFQLKSLGISMVLVGHSERRKIFGDCEAVIQKKCEQLLAHDMAPCYCVGETRNERENGQTETIVAKQLERLWEICQAHPQSYFAQHALVAYEPVWAIGTGLSASPKDISTTHRFIAQRAQKEVGRGIPILYGGSVKADNTYDILAAPGVDGLLVGSASSTPEEFGKIVEEGARK